MRRFALVMLLAALVGARALAAEPEDPAPEAWEERNPCGQIAIYLLARLRNVDLQWDAVQAAVGPADAAGFHSFADLEKGARQLGMGCVGVNARWEDLATFPMPAIVQTRFFMGRPEPHFSVLLRVTSEGAYLLDAPFAPVFMKKADFAKGWAGQCLVFPAAATSDQTFRNDLAGKVTTEWWRRGVIYSSFAVLSLAGALFLWYCAALVDLRPQVLLTVAIGAAGSGVCISAYFALASSRLQPAPVLVLRASQLDLGEVEVGSHTVEVGIANDGTAPLQIQRVKSDCTCAVPEAPAAIDAGQSAALKVVVSARAGARSATVVIDSNDPGGPRAVNIVWFGKSRPALSPNRLECLNVKGDRESRVIHFLYLGGPGTPPPAVASLTWDGMPVGFEVQPELREIEVARGNAPSRSLRDLPILVHVDAAEEPELERRLYSLVLTRGGEEYKYSIPVLIKRHMAIEPETDKVVLVVEGSAPGQINRTVRVWSDVPVEQLAVQSPPWCACRLESLLDGTVLLHIAVHAYGDRAPLSGAIELSAVGQEKSKATIALRTITTD